jgi:hypothetical protein
VREHGSRRLKLSVERRYKSTGTYVRERANQEFPGFLADVSADAKWKARNNPSEDALELEQTTLERVKGLDLDLDVEIVWLTDPPADYWEEHAAFNESEAVTVRGYLGRYDLVQLVDEDDQ